MIVYVCVFVLIDAAVAHKRRLEKEKDKEMEERLSNVSNVGAKELVGLAGAKPGNRSSLIIAGEQAVDAAKGAQGLADRLAAERAGVVPAIGSSEDVQNEKRKSKPSRPEPKGDINRDL